MSHAAARLAAAPALALLAAGCGSGHAVTRTVTRPSTPAATAPPTPAQPAPSQNLTFFKTPSGNIGCALAGDSARCDIAERSWTPPPRPASCPLEWGQGVSVGTSGRASFVCAGDTALNPAAPVLAYGRTSTVGDLSCASAPAGVRCTNTRTSHGFLLARERYELF